MTVTKEIQAMKIMQRQQTLFNSCRRIATNETRPFTEGEYTYKPCQKYLERKQALLCFRGSLVIPPPKKAAALLRVIIYLTFYSLTLDKNLLNRTLH